MEAFVSGLLTLVRGKVWSLNSMHGVLQSGSGARETVNGYYC